MTPREFIEKWQGSTLNEKQSYQAHFSGLCALVGAAVPSPATADHYCFERGVTRTGSKHGWADVWMRGFFGFEYKAPDRSLDAALKLNILLEHRTEIEQAFLLQNRACVEISLRNR